MRQPFSVLCLALLLSALNASAEIVPVDFNEFTENSYPAFHVGSGAYAPANWVVSDGGTTVTETENAYTTVFHGPDNVMNKIIRGTITPGGDDDPVGIVLGYQPGDTSNATANYILIDWKGASQNWNFESNTNDSTPGGIAPAGLAISRVTGLPTADELWQHENLPGDAGGSVSEIARANTLGSSGYGGGTYIFKIVYTATNITVYVNGVEELNIDGNFPSGRFGLYELAQNPGATFTNFSISELDDPDPIGSVGDAWELGDTPNPPAEVSAENPEGLTAYVWDIVDPYSGRAGAGELLRRAGFHVMPLPLDEPPYDPEADPEEDVDLIFISSFASESPFYTQYMVEYADVLDDYIDRAGLLVQMTQNDAVETFPPFLPDTQSASRGDADFTEALVLEADHPLLANVPTVMVGGDAAVDFVNDGVGNFSPLVVWEAFNSFAGFQVVLSGDARARAPALMEGAYGQGRFIMAAMGFDRILDEEGNDLSSASLSAFNEPFFTNLYTHAANVRDRTVQPIDITPPPGETELEDGAWSIVVLPDTQIYSQNYPGLFMAQTAWILENARKRNIRYVLHLGDIVNVNSIREWRNARAAFDIIHGKVPYAFVPGNHDYGPGGNAATRETFMNQHLEYDRYTDWPTFGGAMEPGMMDNTYHLFEAGGVEWIVIALEWGPRDSAIAWADGILQQYPDHKAILVTHAYMNNNDLRYDITDTANPQTYNPHHYSTPGGVNDGQELWDKLVKKHNFVLTLNGHVLGDGTGYRVDDNEAGNPVHQMLVNYQMRNLGGEAYLRILEFQPDGETVRASSFSPVLNNFMLEADQAFAFTIDVGAEDSDSDGVLDYYDDDLDSDGDGLNNYEEFVTLGSNPYEVDSDGDGLTDAQEFDAGSSLVSSDVVLKDYIVNNPGLFGFVSSEDILEGDASDFIIEIDGGELSLSLQLLESSSALGDFTPLGDPVEWNLSLPVELDRQFFRIRITEGAE